VDRRSDDTRQDRLGQFDEVYRRFERLAQEYQTITQRGAGSRVGSGA
jgi:hypothetical protein